VRKYQGCIHRRLRRQLLDQVGGGAKVSLNFHIKFQSSSRNLHSLLGQTFAPTAFLSAQPPMYTNLENINLYYWCGLEKHIYGSSTLWIEGCANRIGGRRKRFVCSKLLQLLFIHWILSWIQHYAYTFCQKCNLTHTNICHLIHSWSVQSVRIQPLYGPTSLRT
jgi:hypothetical protein